MAELEPPVYSALTVSSDGVAMRSSSEIDRMLPSKSMIEAGVPIPAAKIDVGGEREKKIEELFRKVTVLAHEREDALAERDEVMQARDRMLVEHRRELEEQKALVEELTARCNELRRAKTSLTQRLDEARSANAQLMSYVAELEALREASRSGRLSPEGDEQPGCHAGPGSTLEDELVAADHSDGASVTVLASSSPASPAMKSLGFDFGTSSAPLTRSPRLERHISRSKERHHEDKLAKKDRQLKKLQRQLDELRKKVQEQQGGALSDMIDSLIEQLLELGGDDDGRGSRPPSPSPQQDANRRRRRAQTTGPLMQACDTASTRSSALSAGDASVHKKSTVRVRLQVRQDKRNSLASCSTATPGEADVAEVL